MKIKDIISELQKCSPELDITVFDDESRPYTVSDIVVDCEEDGKLSHIIIEPIGT